MPTTALTQSTDYATALARLVAKLPPERAAEVYDFARFLQIQPAHPQAVDTQEADWLNDTAEQLQAEDEIWDAALQQQADQFEALAIAARAEIKAGITQPLFDDTGELIE
jgi:hypothetical protein